MATRLANLEGDSTRSVVILQLSFIVAHDAQVYNWTDSPSIVSEDTLLILDPHHGWSARIPDCSNPGGPMWDFVANAGEIEMKNQMSAFSAIMKELDKHYYGTIIRIPLRTTSQAEVSEICKVPTTASDVEVVLRKFAAEFGTSGLLFMKNVESIGIDIGDDVAFNIKICNLKLVRRHVPHVIYSNILLQMGQKQAVD
jgi:hypothetical protein